MSALVAPGIAVAVAAAVLWGVYLFALKRYVAGVPATVLTVLVNACALAWYAPVALSRLSPGDVPTPATLGLGGSLALVGSVLGVGVGFVLFVNALALGEVSYVTPINKVVPAFVLPLELLLLGADLPALAFVGIAVVTVAVYVANYRGGDPTEPLRRAVTVRPAQLALLSAGAYAVGDVSKRAVLDGVGLPPEALVVVVLGGVLLVLLPLAARDWPGDRATPPATTFIALGLLVATAEHLTSVAFSLLPASVASPVVNTQAVVAVLLGGVLLGERRLGTRLVAAALAVVGVGLLAV
ncbi:EamA family transporter [Halobaculum sp. CBA1158]|uniref:EamA family transporter n=1 Tax=Halobaculum sp. CBA1158 TaxID=2904243 RepID=UPI001F2869BC|nr:EamA family transporter [Halobaculum sp. CBA1158]UIO99619.1 EamA family transporter [Halobaculum sp. CBA1158]